MKYIRYKENGEWKYANIKSVGDLESLLTTNKDDVVSAINELYQSNKATVVDIETITARLDELSSGGGSGGGSSEGLSELEDRVNSLENTTSDIQTDTFDLSARLEDAVSEFNNSIGVIEVEITNNKSTADSLKAQQELLIQREAELKAKQDELITTQITLNSKVNEVESSMSALSEENQSIASELAKKINLETYEQNYQEILADLEGKVDSASYNNLAGKVSTIEQDVVNIEGELSTKITSTEFDDAFGVNQWVASKYVVTGTNLSETPPSFPLIKGLNATEVVSYNDSASLTAFTGDNIITHYFTNVRLKLGYTLTLNVKYEDSLAVYMNGAKIYENKSNGGIAVNISLSLRAGWNTLEILHGNQSGVPVLTLNQAISSVVEKMTTTIGVGNKDETRFVQAETAIIQTSEAIELKADKTEVTNIGNRVTTAEASIEVMSDSISSKVDKTTFDNYSKRLSDAESSIIQNADSIKTKVETTDFNLLNNKVASHTTEINQLSDSIELKVNSTDVYTKTEVDGEIATIETTLSEHGTLISQHDNSIALKANAIDVYTKTEADDNVNTAISNSEASIKLTTDSIISTVETVKTTADKANTKIDNLKIGGINLIPWTDFAKHSSKWKPYNAHATLSFADGWATATCIKDTATNIGLITNPYGRYSIYPSNTYTLSFKAKIGEGSTSTEILLDYIYIMSSDGNLSTSSYWGTGNTPSATAEEKEFVLTFTIPSSSYERTVIGMLLASKNSMVTGDKLMVRDIQLEDGNVKTPWSSSPQDTDDDISVLNETVSSHSTSIIQLDESIALKANSTDVYSKTETDGNISTAISSSEANIKLATDSIISTVSKIQTDVATTQDLAKSMTNGRLVYTDPAFRNGSNGMYIYNNLGNDTVSISRIEKPSDAPTTSTHALEIKTIGEAYPNFGGVVSEFMSRPNAKFVIKYIAKIPIGYSISAHSDSMGDGFLDNFITSADGTGKYEEYIRFIQCGSDGTFGIGGHVSIFGSTTPTEEAPLVWYLASCSLYDITDSDYTSINAWNTANSAVESIAVIEETISSHDTAIEQLEDSITLKANATDVYTKTEAGELVEQKITDSEAKIKLTTDSITSTVSGIEATVEGLENTISSNTTSIEQLEDSIILTATKNELDNLTGRVTTAEGSLSVQSDEISSKVGKDGIISAINQTAETITIDASKISMNGLVSFSNLDTNLQDLINTASSDAQDAFTQSYLAESSADSAQTSAQYALSSANTANNKLASWASSSNTTLIDGGKIYTGSVTAEKINALGLNINNQFIVSSSGNVTFSGALSGASGSFTGSITSSGYVNSKYATATLSSGKIGITTTQDDLSMTIDDATALFSYKYSGNGYGSTLQLGGGYISLGATGQEGSVYVRSLEANGTNSYLSATNNYIQGTRAYFNSTYSTFGGYDTTISSTYTYLSGTNTYIQPTNLYINSSNVTTNKSETGVCGVGTIDVSGGRGSSAVAGVSVNFRIKKSYTPSSITLTASSTAGTLNKYTADITTNGFWFYIYGSGSTNTYCYWRGTYTG